MVFSPVIAATRADAGVKSNKDEASSASKSLTGSYLSGRFASNTGDVGTASDYILDALAQDPHNEDLLNQAFRLQLTNGHIDDAAKIATTLSTKKSFDPIISTLLTLERIKAKDYEAAARYVDVPEADGFNAILVPLTAAWMEVGRGTLKSAFKIDDIAKASGNFAPFVYYHAALINDVAGYKETAQDYYAHAVEDAVNMPYRVVEAFANFYDRNDQHSKATALLAEYKKANPETFLIEDGLIDLSTTPAKASTQPLIGTVQEGVAEMYFAIASILYSEDILPDTLAYIQLALYLRPDFPPAQLMLGSVYEQMNEAAKAITVYDSIHKQSPLYSKGQLRKAFNLDRLGKSEQALRMLEAMTRLTPARYDAWLTRGDILRSRSRFVEAASAYTEAINRLKPVENHHWPIFYVRGIAYERAGRWPKAEADLKRALELEPEQPDVLNYLGYSWLVSGKNIPQARKMIENAVEARPQDAQIIDSMGLALYILGDFSGALEYMERAIELLPADPTINDHLGDVYYRLNRLNEAHFQWERALVFEEDGKLKTAIKAKMENGMPAFKPLKPETGKK